MFKTSNLQNHKRNHMKSWSLSDMKHMSQIIFTSGFRFYTPLRGALHCTHLFFVYLTLDDTVYCSYIKEGQNIKINKNSDWKINKEVSCTSYNVVYMIDCTKDTCRIRYIGETHCWLRARMADHRTLAASRYFQFFFYFTFLTSRSPVKS